MNINKIISTGNIDCEAIYVTGKQQKHLKQGICYQKLLITAIVSYCMHSSVDV